MFGLDMKAWAEWHKSGKFKKNTIEGMRGQGWKQYDVSIRNSAIWGIRNGFVEPGIPYDPASSKGKKDSDIRPPIVVSREDTHPNSEPQKEVSFHRRKE